MLLNNPSLPDSPDRETIPPIIAYTTERWVLTADYNYLDWSRNSSSYTSMKYENHCRRVESAISISPETRWWVAKILATDDVTEIKALGRLVANYSERYWNGIRQIVVFTGLLAKFTQNDDLKAQLAATKGSVLAECAVRDTIWGIGLSMKDPDRLDIDKWKGQNLLGYALMMVRERL